MFVLVIVLSAIILFLLGYIITYKVKVNLKSESDSIDSETGEPILETETVEQIVSENRPIFESYSLDNPKKEPIPLSKNAWLNTDDGLGQMEKGVVDNGKIESK